MSVSGVLIIDKPAGPTSHDIVQRVRRRLQTKKVGHAGTLDPDVTGVLVLCVGDATKLLEYATADEKVYAGSVCFGKSTDTDDASGQVLETASAMDLNREDVEHAARSFVGVHPQMVPRYSAVHIDGKRAYEYARQGLEVDLPTRMVDIQELTVHSFQPGEHAMADFVVRCSKGTYVRALCRDWGQKLGLPAHMARLRRVASGPFDVEESIDLDVFEQSDAPERYLKPPVTALRTLPKCVVSLEVANRLANGQVVPLQGAVQAPLVAVLLSDEELVAVAQADQTRGDSVLLKPRKVFWKREV